MEQMNEQTETEEKNRDQVLSTETRKLPVKLTDDERHAKSLELAEFPNQLADAEDEMEAAASKPKRLEPGNAPELPDKSEHSEDSQARGVDPFEQADQPVEPSDDGKDGKLF